MTPELPKDLREFVELLVEREIDFLVVGAFALAFHGHPRYTGDIDVLVRSSQKNAEKLEKLIQEFGFGSTGLKASDFYDPDLVVQLGYPPNRIDIITKIDGVPFEDAWTNRVKGELDGITVNYISRHDFLANKRASGRPKDLSDIAELDRS